MGGLDRGAVRAEDRPRGPAAPRLDHAPGAGDRLADLARLRTFVAKSATIWLDVFWAPLFIVGVYLVHPLLGAIAAAAALLLVLLGWVQEATTRGVRRAARDATETGDDLLASAGRHLEAVGAHAMTDNLAARWWRSAALRLDERERADGRAAGFAAMIRGLGECTGSA